MANNSSGADQCATCLKHHPIDDACWQADFHTANRLREALVALLSTRNAQGSAVIDPALTNTITTNSPAQASSYASAASSSSERLPWSPDLAQPANAEDVLANLHLGDYTAASAYASTNQTPASFPGLITAPAAATQQTQLTSPLAPPLTGDLLPAPRLIVDLRQLVRPQFPTQQPPAPDNRKNKKRKADEYPISTPSHRHENEILEVGDCLTLQVEINGLVINEQVEVMGIFRGLEYVEPKDEKKNDEKDEEKDEKKGKEKGKIQQRTFVFYNRIDTLGSRSFGMFSNLGDLAQELARPYPHVTRQELDTRFHRPYSQFFVFRGNDFLGTVSYHRQSVCRARGWAEVDDSLSGGITGEPKAKRVKKRE